MARGKPVLLPTIEFQNQSLAHEYFKKMLNRYVPGEDVTKLDAEHLLSLFKRHPDYDNKVGCGIRNFAVMPGDYGSQCFCIIRMDGSREEFSYLRCVTQRGKK